MQNMETLYLRATPFVAAPTARQGAETAWRRPKKPRPVCNAPDMPTSVRSLFAKETVEPSLRRKSK
jgi:hypothetical protein